MAPLLQRKHHHMAGMTGFEIFWPLLAHVLLVYGLYGLLHIRRQRLLRQGLLTIDAIRSSSSDPIRSQLVRNAIASQFEIPVLFYLCTILLYLTEGDSVICAVLAWIFVASRYGHAAVHVTTNCLLPRFALFVIGAVALGFMWIWLAMWMFAS